MPPVTIAFHDRSVAVDAAPAIAPDVAAFFRLCRPATESAPPLWLARIGEEAPSRFRLEIPNAKPVTGLTRGEVLRRLATAVGRDAFFDGPGVPIEAAAVGWGNKAALILGEPSAGKSSLAAWFVEKGFAYVADDSVLITPFGDIAGFPGPLAFRTAAIARVAALPTFHNVPSAGAGEQHMLVCPEPTWAAAEGTAACGLLIVPNYEPGATLSTAALSVNDVALRLLESTRRIVIPGDPDHALLARLAGNTPALRITYGDLSQFDGVLDFLARAALEMEPDREEFARFVGGLPRATPPEKKTWPVPARSDRSFSPKLTIGMATYDDFDGVYFTLQAIRLYHPEVLNDVEFVVIDNHPDGPAAELLKTFEKFIPNLRYIPMVDNYGTAPAKDRVFTEAGGTFVICMDCHILIAPGALSRLLRYIDEHPDTRDLLQGPVIHDSLAVIRTHNEPVWSNGFYGTWATNPAGEDPDAPPFEIQMQNTGLFACRRAAWPGFNRQFRGFVAEEGYIHEKIRMAGGRTLCLPFLRCIHRFHRVQSVPYPNTWEDRIRNCLIAAGELGTSTDEMTDHFRSLLGVETANRLIAAGLREIEALGPPH